jgi:uncharacterized protein YraI
MKILTSKKRNFIILISFAAFFSVFLAIGMIAANQVEEYSAAELSSSAVATAISEDIGKAVAETETEVREKVQTVSVSQEEATVELTRTVFTVTEYDAPKTKYTSDTVNVRSGAGTDYDKVGKLSWGSAVEVTGETDNEWYEVSFKGTTAFIKGEYVVDELPGTPYVFVGDSRTVQLQMAVGSSDKAYIAKIGEGYSWFKNSALSLIPVYAGRGTKMVINFGVNDLANAGKYISLVNSYVDTWTNAGITVYYASVTPVGAGASVTNAQIESFNAQLQAGLDSRIQWIDGYTYLQQAGFTTGDGLHYNAATYRSLYSYYMSVIG